MSPHPNPDIRRQLQRGRELHEDRMAEAAALAEQQRKHEMTTRKTNFGDRVPKFPETSPLLDLVEELREELTALYDEAAAMQERNERMARSAKPDTSRFPAMKET